jgi:long-chain acyl-CoA synthetase
MLGLCRMTPTSCYCSTTASVRVLVITLLHVLRRIWSEFLISDLALASHSIPSFTITSPSLLSPILESHPPTAIITHAHFLPNLLELIYDANESEHHTVIVVGDFDPKVLAKAGKTTKVLKWTDVEREGAQGETITSAPPS